MISFRLGALGYNAGTVTSAPANATSCCTSLPLRASKLYDLSRHEGAAFVSELQRFTMITNRNDIRDSTDGRSMRMQGEPRDGTHFRRSMWERSRTLARTRRSMREA